MPVTPYHFGPSGFLGLVFRRWLDVPVFVLANVVVDIEVLCFANFRVHRYAHTLLIGAAVGAVWGLAAIPLRRLFSWAMPLLGLSYQTTVPKMLVSGVLGVWLHVLVDGLYHYDVWPLWPSRKLWLWNIAARHIGYNNMAVLQEYIKLGCVLFFVAAIVLYLFIRRKGRPKEKCLEPASRGAGTAV